jgi:hypothetical protein
MHVFNKVAISAFCVLGMSIAAAQAGPGAGGGQGKGPHWNSDNTPGWSLMTAEEREAHQQRMADMKNREECQAYMAEHHDQMTARAKEQGRKALAKPRRDPCARINP